MLTTKALLVGRWRPRLAFTATAFFALAGQAVLSPGVQAQVQAGPARSDLTRPLFPQRTIFWFNSYDPGRTVWNEAQVYHSADTTVRTATAESHDFQVWRDKQITGLPVETVDGVRSLVIDTVNPGDWNLHFIMGSGNVVNLDRVGPAPILHLRMKWGTILPDRLGDVKISVDKASVLLSQYATPSTTKWQDVNIPLADFQRAVPGLNLSQTGGISLSSVHRYAAESVFYLSEMCVVPALGPAALREDLVKVDQSGWRTRDPKRALFTYPYAASEGGVPPNARFDVRSTGTNKVVYAGHLIRRDATESKFPAFGSEQTASPVFFFFLRCATCSTQRNSGMPSATSITSAAATRLSTLTGRVSPVRRPIR